MSRKAAKRTLLISGAVIALAGVALVFLTTLGRGTLSIGGLDFDMLTSVRYTSLIGGVVGILLGISTMMHVKDKKKTEKAAHELVRFLAYFWLIGGCANAIGAVVLLIVL